MPDLEVEVKCRLREVEVEVNLYNVSKDVTLSQRDSSRKRNSGKNPEKAGK